MFDCDVYFQENPLSNIRRVDCALLPPCRKSLEMKIKRTRYVAIIIWSRAVTPLPGDGLSPIEYGWHVKDNLLQPFWFEGTAVPHSLFSTENENMEKVEHEDSEHLSDMSDTKHSDETLSDSDGGAWSEDSNSDDENRFDV